ncbi:hypothetical protein WR25_15375 [Diploscapter pachys]|uniref:Uncharacterized protein n=1 Tax=Diploscapter pachys TaxID=2018661 RepID=A0A2A2KG55_9BILA|nr:hypothetical protein WR25_15375 [Diploscapter pachys]
MPRLRAALGDALEREVVGFGCAGGPDQLVGLRANLLGHLLAGMLDGFAGRLAPLPWRLLGDHHQHDQEHPGEPRHPHPQPRTVHLLVVLAQRRAVAGCLGGEALHARLQQQHWQPQGADRKEDQQRGAQPVGGPGHAASSVLETDAVAHLVRLTDGRQVPFDADLADAGAGARFRLVAFDDPGHQRHCRAAGDLRALVVAGADLGLQAQWLALQVQAANVEAPAEPGQMAQLQAEPAVHVARAAVAPLADRPAGIGQHAFDGRQAGHLRRGRNAVLDAVDTAEVMALLVENRGRQARHRTAATEQGDLGLAGTIVQLGDAIDEQPAPVARGCRHCGRRSPVARRASGSGGGR